MLCFAYCWAFAGASCAQSLAARFNTSARSMGKGLCSLAHSNVSETVFSSSCIRQASIHLRVGFSPIFFASNSFTRPSISFESNWLNSSTADSLASAVPCRYILAFSAAARKANILLAPALGSLVCPNRKIPLVNTSKVLSAHLKFIPPIMVLISHTRRPPW